MTSKINFIELSGRAQTDIEARVAAGDGFRVIGRADFPQCLPPSLAAKFDSAVQIVSGSGTDSACLVWNFRRVDGSDIDEHPFGVFVVSGSVSPSGAFLDHGNWPNRTTPIDPMFAAHISASGIGNYFLANPPNGMGSGSLAQLGSSDTAAYSTFIRIIE